MSSAHGTESVVVCDACGFAGLLGFRVREWVPYQMAATRAGWVSFGFCTACGLTCVRPNSGWPLSRQPKPLAFVRGAVRVAPWESVPDDSEPGACPGCGAAEDGLLWNPYPRPDDIDRVYCPCCWAGPLRFTDHRASHPGW